MKICSSRFYGTTIILRVADFDMLQNIDIRSEVHGHRAMVLFPISLCTILRSILSHDRVSVTRAGSRKGANRKVRHRLSKLFHESR